MLPVGHEFIIKAAMELIQADSKLGLSYNPDTFQTRNMLDYLASGNKDEVNNYLAEAVRYYLGLAKFIYEEGKEKLSG